MPATGMISWSVLASIRLGGPPGRQRGTDASGQGVARACRRGARWPADSIDRGCAHGSTGPLRTGPESSTAPPVYSPACEPAIPAGSQRPALGCLFEVVETLVLTILIFLGIQTFVAQPYRVQQMSMEV